MRNKLLLDVLALEQERSKDIGLDTSFLADSGPRRLTSFVVLLPNFGYWVQCQKSKEEAKENEDTLNSVRKKANEAEKAAEEKEEELKSALRKLKVQEKQVGRPFLSSCLPSLEHKALHCFTLCFYALITLHVSHT